MSASKIKYRIIEDEDKGETPDPRAEILHNGQWVSRPYPDLAYLKGNSYRVPIDPPPVPQNEPWSDIPPCESNPAAVVIWIIGALVFLTGFLIGWSL